MLWIAFAIVFVVTLFLQKNKTVFKNSINYVQNKQEEGLTYNNEILGNLVSKDSDGDGVLDWEESLWGTDPTKKDTNDDGTPDNIEIDKLKKETSQNESGESLNLSPDDESLTETDKFSREFFATVATLNQNGAMDQATADKLGASLAERIQNSAPRKIFLLSDIKVSKGDNAQAVQKYSESLYSIYKKYPMNYIVMDVLQKLIVDGNGVDIDASSELNSIIEQTTKVVDAMAKMSVPQSIASLHLDLLNGFERLVENLNDIKLYNTDVIVALSAISQYEKNVIKLATAVGNLNIAINKN